VTSVGNNKSLRTSTEHFHDILTALHTYVAWNPWRGVVLITS